MAHQRLPTRDDMEEMSNLAGHSDYELGGPDTMEDNGDDDGKTSAPYNTNDPLADYIMNVYR